MVQIISPNWAWIIFLAPATPPRKPIPRPFCWTAILSLIKIMFSPIESARYGTLYPEAFLGQLHDYQKMMNCQLRFTLTNPPTPQISQSSAYQSDRDSS